MSTAILIIGLVGVFGGLTLALVSTGVLTTERTGVSRSLAAVESLGSLPENARNEMEPPFSQRVLAPIGERLASFARRFTPQERIDRLRRRMLMAGASNSWTVERVLAAKTLATFSIGALSAMAMLALGKPTWALVLGIGGAALGWFLPEIILKHKADKRSHQIQKDLPDVLDLLTISVEAGMGFDAALANVARNTKGPVADEFFRVLQEMQLGAGRMDALRALNDRTDVEDLGIFVNAMTQADAFGIPIAHVLRAQAKEMRIKRAQRAEEQAQKIPVKMTFPTIFFILPTLLVIVVGPAVVNVASDLLGAF